MQERSLRTKLSYSIFGCKSSQCCPLCQASPAAVTPCRFWALFAFSLVFISKRLRHLDRGEATDLIGQQHFAAFPVCLVIVLLRCPIIGGGVAMSLALFTRCGCKHPQTLLEDESQRFLVSKPMFWSTEPEQHEHITVMNTF